MGLRDKLKTCSVAEKDGVWFDVLDTGSSFRCRRFYPGNVEAWAAYEEALKPFFVEPDESDPDDAGSYDFSSDEAKNALVSVWAEHVVVDWQNVTPYDIHGEGHSEEEDAPYTPEDCVKVFREYEEVFAAVSDQAARRENYLLALRKKQVKN